MHQTKAQYHCYHLHRISSFNLLCYVIMEDATGIMGFHTYYSSIILWVLQIQQNLILVPSYNKSKELILHEKIINLTIDSTYKKRKVSYQGIDKVVKWTDMLQAMNSRFKKSQLETWIPRELAYVSLYLTNVKTNECQTQPNSYSSKRCKSIH